MALPILLVMQAHPERTIEAPNTLLAVISYVLLYTIFAAAQKLHTVSF